MRAKPRHCSTNESGPGCCQAREPSAPLRCGAGGEAGPGPVWRSHLAGTVTARWPGVVRGPSSRGAGAPRHWYRPSTSPSTIATNRTGSVTVRGQILYNIYCHGRKKYFIILFIMEKYFLRDKPRLCTTGRHCLLVQGAPTTAVLWSTRLTSS